MPLEEIAKLMLQPTRFREQLFVGSKLLFDQYPKLLAELTYGKRVAMLLPVACAPTKTVRSPKLRSASVICPTFSSFNFCIRIFFHTEDGTLL